MTTVSHLRRHVRPTNGVRAFFRTPLGRFLHAIAEVAAIVSFMAFIATLIALGSALGWI
jgi:hypothetical protein